FVAERAAFPVTAYPRASTADQLLGAQQRTARGLHAGRKKERKLMRQPAAVLAVEHTVKVASLRTRASDFECSVVVSGSQPPGTREEGRGERDRLFAALAGERE